MDAAKRSRISYVHRPFIILVVISLSLYSCWKAIEVPLITEVVQTLPSPDHVWIARIVEYRTEASFGGGAGSTSVDLSEVSQANQPVDVLTVNTSGYEKYQTSIEWSEARTLHVTALSDGGLELAISHLGPITIDFQFLHHVERPPEPAGHEPDGKAAQ